MKHPDVNMSPPANILTFRQTLTHVTFNIDHVTFDLHPCHADVILMGFFVQ